MIDIVIVNWNAGQLLRNCINSIISTTDINLVHKIIIIDNDSTDNSLQLLPEHRSIHIIRNDRNEGFSKAANCGFRESDQKYILLLNPDTEVYKTTLSDSLRFMETHSDTDIMGCQLYNEEGKLSRSCSRFPTPLTFFFDATGLSKLAPKIFTPALLMTDWDHQSSRKVDQVMGAFMFMRRDVFKKSGYFDELYFVYFEDLDFSKQLAQKGGKSFFNATIKAYHRGGGTTASASSYRLFLFLSGKLRYCKKHFSLSGYLFVLFTTLFIEPFTRTFYQAFNGRFREIPNIWKGYYRFLVKKK